MKGIALLAAITVLGSCSQSEDVSGYDGLVAYVSRHPVGNGADQWIEMKNLSGEWEKTGLVFGYSSDDYGECTKAIAGLKRINFAREYRCVPANQAP